MTTLELNKMGLQELSSTEAVELEGGGFWGWLGEKLLEALAEDMVTNPGDYVSSGHDTVLGHWGGARP